MHDVIVHFDRMYDVTDDDQVDRLFDLSAADAPKLLGRSWNLLLVDLCSGPALLMDSILIPTTLICIFR